MPVSGPQRKKDANMNIPAARKVRGHALLVAVFFMATALLTSCASAGGISLRVDFPLKKDNKVEVNVEQKDEQAKVKRKKHGPPPHAPAHGYRHKNPDGTELVFDSGLGVYAVVEVSGVFFQNVLYMRSVKNTWQVSASVEGPWRRAGSKEVPGKLKAARGKKHPGKGKGRVSRK